MPPNNALPLSDARLRWAALGLAFLALASCWAMPLKMLLGADGSYYTFAVIGDEMIYANRMQPLNAGATIQNPINGFCDPEVLSPYLLEDIVRELVTLSGLHIITVFWIWRFVFPVLLLGSLFVLAKAVLPKRYGSWPLALILASLFFAIHFGVYALVVDYPPMGGWILRIPTNVEYILVALLGAAMVRFALTRQLSAGLISVALLAALIYLRPYSGMPWAICAAAAMAAMLLRRELATRSAAVVAAVLFAALIPLLIIFQVNAGIPAFKHTMARYFKPMDYALHPKSAVFILIGVMFALACFRAPRRLRALIGAAAATMLVLPFVSGISSSMRHELLRFDRYSPFYLAMLGVVPALLLRRRLTLPSLRRLRQPALYACVLAAAFLLAQVVRYGAFNYRTYYCGSFGYLCVDEPNIKGYQWLRDHSAPNAMVLVDDRIHWGALGPEWTDWAEGLRAAWSEDLFQVISRRRPVYHWRLYGSFMTHEQYAELVMLQRITFGLEFPDEAAADRTYARLLAWYKPGYVFWRKGRPGLRGRGERLRKIAKVEYSDEACEIWKLDYPAGFLETPKEARPESILDPAPPSTTLNVSVPIPEPRQ